MPATNLPSGNDQLRFCHEPQPADPLIVSRRQDTGHSRGLRLYPNGGPRPNVQTRERTCGTLSFVQGRRAAAHPGRPRLGPRSVLFASVRRSTRPEGYSRLGGLGYARCGARVKPDGNHDTNDRSGVRTEGRTERSGQTPPVGFARKGGAK